MTNGDGPHEGAFALTMKWVRTVLDDHMCEAHEGNKAYDARKLKADLAAVDRLIAAVERDGDTEEVINRLIAEDLAGTT